MLMGDRQVIEPQCYSTSPHWDFMHMAERDNGTKNLKLVSNRSQAENHQPIITGRELPLNQDLCNNSRQGLRTFKYAKLSFCDPVGFNPYSTL